MLSCSRYLATVRRAHSMPCSLSISEIWLSDSGRPGVSLATIWRISVSYWRIGGADAAPPPQARAVRKTGGDLDAQALRAIARAPLRPIRPQKALDIGLFEVRPPEAPHILMPDE